MSDKEAQLEQLSMFTHELWLIDDFGSSYIDGNIRRTGTDTANVFSSQIRNGPNAGMHTVAIDLDLPATLVPSSMAGHYHLYIDKPMEWPAYEALLNALTEAGLVQPGYRDASVERGWTSLRLPWVRKETP